MVHVGGRLVKYTAYLASECSHTSPSHNVNQEPGIVLRFRSSTNGVADDYIVNEQRHVTPVDVTSVKRQSVQLYLLNYERVHPDTV